MTKTQNLFKTFEHLNFEFVEGRVNVTWESARVPSTDLELLALHYRQGEDEI
jgi:hypothetical protein